MGVSSSRPFPSSQDNNNRTTCTPNSSVTSNFVKCAPHYTPTMDDEAASQQLMSEARGTHAADDAGPAIPLSFEKASQNTIADTPESGKKKPFKPRRKPPVASQQSPRDALPNSPLPTYSLKELQAFVDPSPSKSQPFPSTIPSTQIEIPETQTDSQPIHAPSSTPLASSHAAAQTGSSSKKKSKKGARSKHTDAGLNEEMQDERTRTDADTPSAVPKTRKPRRKEQPSNSQTELAGPKVEQDTIPATQYEKATKESTLTSPNTTEGQASRKRRRKDKSRTSTHRIHSDLEEVAETPTATQENASDALVGGSHERNHTLDAEEQSSIPVTQLGRLKTEKAHSPPEKPSSKKAQKRQFANKTSKPLVAGDAPEAQARLSNTADTATPRETANAAQPSKKRKLTRRDKEVTETPLLDWDPPVRNLDETPAQPFTYEDCDELESSLDVDKGSDTKTESSTLRRKKKSANGKKTRPSIGGVPRTPSRRNPRSRADPNRNYQRDRDEDQRTAAEIALDHTHELGQPPDKRTNGEYTADEKELLRRAIRDYQERNGLETADLVEIIQWNHVRKKEMGANTTDQTEAQYKQDSIAFWEDVKSAGLLRNLSDIKRHIRTRYHTCQRGHWSQEEDEHLKELANLHPGQWKLIATHLNRLELDVYNRWKDYVRHGENRITKRWSKEEEENFVNVLSVVCQRIEDHRAETGKPPLDDYTPVINWHEVCREMGDTRSRLQCQSKWKLMRAREPPAAVDVEIKPRKTPEPGQVEEVEEPQKKRRQSKSKKEPKSTVTPEEFTSPGPEDMLWGDKFDLVFYITEHVAANGYETDDQIAWQDIAEKMKPTWSVPTLQTAYRDLQELVDGEEDLMASLNSIFIYIKEHHKSEMDDRYKPLYEPEIGEEDAPALNSSKKRKRQCHTESDLASAKRKKATSNSSKAFKSKELITDSDNTESDSEP